MTQQIAPSSFSAKVLLVGVLGAFTLKLIACTLRWTVIWEDEREQRWSAGAPRILTFWHGQQLMMPWVYRRAARRRERQPVAALISAHEDGRMVARAMRFLGIDSVAGSSSRGGREAMFALIERLKIGHHVAITPDGPKGPACEVKPGVIRIAQRSQAPVLPAAFAAERMWTFGSWDKMVLPLPFSRAVFVVGRPIMVPSEIGSDGVGSYARALASELNRLSERALRHFAPSEPPTVSER